MPIIEPIPMDQLSPVSKMVIESGCDEGLYATPIPLQIFAYNTRKLISMDETRRLRGDGSLLGGRILELIRIRSAQLGECQPCMQSRKHDSITDEDVACLLDVDASDLTDQERLAVKFIDLLSADHHAIDADFYGELAAVFTAAQIVELGLTLRRVDGPAPVHPHAGGVRHRRAGDPVLARPGRHGRVAGISRECQRGKTSSSVWPTFGQVAPVARAPTDTHVPGCPTGLRNSPKNSPTRPKRTAPGDRTARGLPGRSFVVGQPARQAAAVARTWRWSVPQQPPSTVTLGTRRSSCASWPPNSTGSPSSSSSLSSSSAWLKRDTLARTPRIRGGDPSPRSMTSAK